MDRGAWLATVHGATESWIWLRLNTHIICLWTLFTLFHSFCSSDWVISNVLSSRSVILSSACLNLLFRRRQWHPTPVFLHGKSHGWRSLVDTVHGVARSWTQLSDFPFTFHFHALEKEMATRSSVFAWRILGTEEPGGLPSMGSHRVGHDWRDLAVAVILLSNSKISCFLFYSCRFLMNFSFCSCIDFLFLFNCLFSCSPLKFLKMIVLNSLS